MNILSNDGPEATGRHVIEVPDVSELHYVSADRAKEEATISFTARAAAYASAGWVKAAATVESPWVSGSLEASLEASRKATESESTVFVTGRYVFPQCTIALPIDVRPHPTLQRAVNDALDIKDTAERTKALSRVFRQWGHVYVSAVEMGAMKHVTTEKKSVTKVRHLTISCSCLR